MSCKHVFPFGSKRDAVALSVEERTPKRLASLEPDLVVIVGGVEFYHYRAILCDACPLIDTMLSKNMKEANELVVRFPDKDPFDWLTVNKFLDPKITETEKDSLFRTMLPKKKGDETVSVKMCNLLGWFDYLGMDSLLTKYDKMAAATIEKFTLDTNQFPSRSCWIRIRDSPCHFVKKVLKRLLEYFVLRVAWQAVHRQGYTPSDAVQQVIKATLLDDELGDESWASLVEAINFPPEMLLELERKTIVDSPLFIHILRMSAKGMAKPEHTNRVFSEDGEEINKDGNESTDDGH